MIFFSEIKETFLKFIGKQKLPRVLKAVMNKKNNTREIKVPVIELYYRTIFTKPAWYWHKKK